MHTTLTHRKSWFNMKQEPNTIDFEITRWLDRLNEVVRLSDAKWGVNKLPELVNKETRDKWDTQTKKLTDALVERDLHKVIGLVQGSIRGLSMLEQEAQRNGHKPDLYPDAWSILMPDNETTLVLVKTKSDALLMKDKLGDAIVWTFEEISNVIWNTQMITNTPAYEKVKNMQEIKKKDETIWDFIDDSIPF